MKTARIPTSWHHLPTSDAVADIAASSNKDVELDRARGIYVVTVGRATYYAHFETAVAS